MKKLVIGFILVTVFFLVNEVSAQSVSGSIGTIKRGGSARGTITLSIPGGLHVNSNRPGSEYAIPTVVTLSSPNAKVSGVSYPLGKARSFSYSNGTVRIYEGQTRFGFTVSVPANFKGNTVKIRAVVRYQACTDEVCYPPKTKEVTLTANVR